LGWNESSDGVRRNFREAVLLGHEDPLRLGIPQAAARRENRHTQRSGVCPDNGILLGQIGLCADRAAQPDPRVNLRRVHPRLERHRSRLHLHGRPDVGDLQRGAAVFPRRAVVRLLAHGLSGLPARHGCEGHELADRTPLISAIPRMMIPALVILPGLIRHLPLSQGRHRDALETAARPNDTSSRD